MEFYEKCKRCGGTGWFTRDDGCNTCGGSGKIMTDALTIEDWFAGMAMSKMIDKWFLKDLKPLAEAAYIMADAMVAERKRRRIGPNTSPAPPG